VRTFGKIGSRYRNLCTGCTHPTAPKSRGCGEGYFNWRRVLGATLELLDVIDPSLLMDK